MSNMTNKKETATKAPRLSKKVLLREIAERNDLFNFNALERTSIQNLKVIRDLLVQIEAAS